MRLLNTFTAKKLVCLRGMWSNNHQPILIVYYVPDIAPDAFYMLALLIPIEIILISSF